MYSIQRASYGLRITMGGLYAPGEIGQYLAERDAAISEIDGPYCLFVDLRSAIPPNHQDQRLLAENYSRLRQGALTRTAITVASPTAVGGSVTPPRGER